MGDSSEQSVRFRHDASLLARHRDYLAVIGRTAAKLAHLDRTSRFLKVAIICEHGHPVETRGLNGSVTERPTLLATLPTSGPQAACLLQGLEMGFRAAYFIPSPACDQYDFSSGLPRTPLESWIEIVGVAPESHGRYLLSLPPGTPSLRGVEGAVLLQPKSANEVVLQFLRLLRDEPERFPLSLASYLLHHPEDQVRQPKFASITGMTDDQAYGLHFHRANPVTMIWGPPGTGKSTVLCRIIADDIEQGGRVLVTAASNDAVDSVAKKLCEARYSDPLIEAIRAGSIRRLGISKRAREFAPLVGPREESEESQAILATLYRVLVDGAACYDTVIIEEAGMIPPPVMYCAASLAAKRLVVCGDPKQGDPVFTAKPHEVGRRAFEAWSTNIYEALNLRLAPGDRPDSRVCLLTTQFRMSDDIAEYVRETGLYPSYRSPDVFRQPSPQETAARNARPLPGTGVAVLDTTGLPAARSSHNVNHEHFRLVTTLAAEYVATPGLNPVGIVTPYRAQAELYHQWLKEHNLHNRVIAGTVHRFQGSECPLVLFDTVEAPSLAAGERRTHYWTDDFRNPKALKILNVAVSRAKAKLVLVVHGDYIREKLSAGCYLQRAIHLASSRHAVLPAHHFLADNRSAAALRPDPGGRPTAFARQPATFASHSLSSQFMTDARSTCAAIDLASPTIDHGFVAALAETLEATNGSNGTRLRLFVPSRLPKADQSFLEALARSRSFVSWHRLTDWPHGDAYAAFDEVLRYEPGNKDEPPSFLAGLAPRLTVRICR